MSNLQYRQTKIQEKRKQTPWRDFVMEIASWQPISLNKQNNTITRYAQRRSNIINHKEFAIIRDGLLNYGLNISNDDIFFSSLNELFCVVPKSNLLFFGTNENSNYADVAFNAKNSYLSYHTTIDVENILYSISIKNNCSTVISSMCVNSSNNVFQSRGIFRSYNIFYCSSILDSSNIWFSDNLIGCSECLYCNNIQSQSYCINNIAYDKEEYEFKKKELLTHKQHQKYNTPLNTGSSACEGLGIIDSYNIINGFFATAMRNGKNVVLASSNDTISNVYDVFGGCGKPGEGGYYATHSCGGCDDAYCSSSMAFCNNCYYSFHLESCSFCLGCIGLKNKSYCILNKQYTKEEWYEKVDEIFSQMEDDGTLGQFFPASMNPFYFNDTAAYLIDPSFTKEEVTAAGYLWRDEPIKVDIPEGAEIVKIEDLDKFEKWLPSGDQRESSGGEGGAGRGLWTIDKEILKKIVQDEQGNVYRIVPMEYDFLMKYGLPLPRKHWLDRMRENFRIA